MTAVFISVKEALNVDLWAKQPMLVGIDGHGDSGKSTFAAALAKNTGATIVHTDDFY